MKILSNKIWARNFAAKHNIEIDMALSVEDGIERADAIAIFVDNFDKQNSTAEMCREYPKSYALVVLSDNNTNFAPAGVDTLYITGQDYFQTPNAIHKIHQILNSLLGEYI